MPTPQGGHVLDGESEARIRRLAEEESIGFEEAMEMALHVGLEVCESQAGERRDRLDDLAGEIRDVKTCLHLVGRAALASNVLLAHWAARSGGVRVSEEELSRELEAVGSSRWADQLAQLGMVTPQAE